MPDWSIPGYTEMKALGSGGFGDVVVAKHDASGMLVAIKYLHRDLFSDPQFAAMFRGEAAVLASMDDPNVARLYEYIESPGGAAIVMELVPGVSLREILSHRGKTTPEAALAALQGSLLGLAAAHRRGVVHRGYKPANVLINGDGVSKLTDFGLAARTGDRPVAAGTLAYVAPEQIAGAPATPASDIYSATATFYQCLTGSPPFPGESAELMRAHQFQPVPLDPVPGPLQPLVAAGMAKDPRDRPGDALTFASHLQAAATAGYGEGWEDRGRSHLGEAALLLAALWPAGLPPVVQATAARPVSLLRRVRSLLRRVGPVQAAIAIGAATMVAAAGTALAGPPSQPPASINTALVHKFSFLQHVVLMKRYKNGEDWYTATWGVCPVSVKPTFKPSGHALYTVNFPYALKRLRFVQKYEAPRDLYLALRPHPSVNTACWPSTPGREGLALSLSPSGTGNRGPTGRTGTTTTGYPVTTTTTTGSNPVTTTTTTTTGSPVTTTTTGNPVTTTTTTTGNPVTTTTTTTGNPVTTTGNGPTGPTGNG